MMYQHAAKDRDRRVAEGLDAMAEEAGLRPSARDVPPGPVS